MFDVDRIACSVLALAASGLYACSGSSSSSEASNGGHATAGRSDQYASMHSGATDDDCGGHGTAYLYQNFPSYGTTATNDDGTPMHLVGLSLLPTRGPLPPAARFATATPAALRACSLRSRSSASVDASGTTSASMRNY